VVCICVGVLTAASVAPVLTDTTILCAEPETGHASNIDSKFRSAAYCKFVADCLRSIACFWVKMRQ
jgi:hypothetical protein